MAIKYVESFIQCPFCQDKISFSQEQLETLEALGDHGFDAVSETCGSMVEIRTANSLVYDADGQVLHANTRIFWNRVQTERVVKTKD